MNRFSIAWLISFLLLGGLAVTWSFATPMPSGGDEPAHAIKAAAVVRGQLTGARSKGLRAPSAVVVIPAVVNNLGAVAGCYYRSPSQPSHPCHWPSARPGLVKASTYEAHYPPAYYGIVGLPTAFSKSEWSLRLMRVVSSLIGGVFLALALAMAVMWSANRWLVVGVAAGITPVSIYMASIVNPSGLEIATALAAWTAATLLVLDRRAPTAAPLLSFVVCCGVMVFTRPLAFLWAPVIVATVVLLDFHSSRQLWKFRSVRLAVALVAVATAGAAAFVWKQRSLDLEQFPLPRSVTTAQIEDRLFHLIPVWIEQFVGQFGSPNFGGPRLSVILWLTGCAAMIIWGIYSSPRWQAFVLVLFGLGSVVALPYLTTLSHARLQGLGWQGRYNLPLAVGIPVLFAAIAGERRPLGTARVALVGIWVVAQASSLYYVFCRYTVGLGSLFHPFKSVVDPWDPPLGRPLTLALGALVVVASGAWLWVCAQDGAGPGHRRRRRVFFSGVDASTRFKATRDPNSLGRPRSNRAMGFEIPSPSAGDRTGATGAGQAAD